jgi:hypothetical protein
MLHRVTYAHCLDNQEKPAVLPFKIAVPGYGENLTD